MPPWAAFECERTGWTLDRIPTEAPSAAAAIAARCPARPAPMTSTSCCGIGAGSVLGGTGNCGLAAYCEVDGSAAVGRPQLLADRRRQQPDGRPQTAVDGRGDCGLPSAVVVDCRLPPANSCRLPSAGCGLVRQWCRRPAAPAAAPV